MKGSSSLLLSAACPENVLHARKTLGMLLLAHFAGDGVSVTRLVCWLVCRISWSSRFSGGNVRRKGASNVRVSIQVTYEKVQVNIDKDEIIYWIIL